MNLAVITCHFNPAGYHTPRRNFFRFMRELDRAQIPLYVAELAYDSEPWLLPERSSVLRLRTSGRHVMWHKENLLNLAQKIVPEEYDAIAWIDADLWFERHDWAAAAEAALEQYAVIQLFAKVFSTSRDGRLERTQHSAGAAGHLNPQFTTPGFAWAARRSLWHKAGGLYERAVIGGGDMVNASAWLPTDPPPYQWLHYPGLPSSLEPLRQWCSSEGGCGAISGSIWHEWHGTIANRQYTERHTLVRNINLDLQLRRREDGLLEFDDSLPQSLTGEFRKYFFQRNEDGPSHADGPPTQASRLDVWSKATRYSQVASHHSLPLPPSTDFTTLYSEFPMGEAVLLVSQGSDRVDAITINIHLLRKHWAGPIVVCHFGELALRLRVICQCYAVCLREFKHGQHDALSTLVPTAMEACPFAHLLYLPLGTVVRAAISFSPLSRHRKTPLHWDGSTPVLGFRSALPLQMFEVPFALAANEVSSADPLILCHGDPSHWSETAWEEWCVADADASLAFAREIRLPENTSVSYIVPAADAGHFQRNWLAFKFPKTVPIFVYLVDLPADGFWLPGASDVSIHEISSDQLHRLDRFLPLLLEHSKGSSRSLFMPPDVTSISAEPFLPENDDSLPAIILNVSPAAFEAGRATGIWEVPNPFLGIFSREALEEIARDSTAKTAAFGDLPRIAHLLSQKHPFSLTYATLVHQSPDPVAQA